MHFGQFFDNQHQSNIQGERFAHFSPMDSNRLLYEWSEQTSTISERIHQAQVAQTQWKKKSLEERGNSLLRLKESLSQKTLELARQITEDTGKAFWESKIEAAALIKKIDITVEQVGQLVSSIESFGSIKDRQWMRFQPRGVCAVIGPFNFPLHLPHGHIVPALLMGNAVLFKPSEWTVASSLLYAECFADAGFPPNLLQVLPGKAEMGKALVQNENINGIFFTGSYDVGRQITKQLFDSRSDLSTIAALEMGGKNALVVHKDARLEKASAEALMSSFVTTGQRCSCSSRIFIHESVYEDFKSRFLDKAKRMVAGDPFDEKTFMGPMIHESARNRFREKLQESMKEGFRTLLSPEVHQEKSGYISACVLEAPTPAEDVYKKTLQEEYFGPQTTFVPYSKTEDLVKWHEAAPFGLVTSLFSDDEKLFNQLDESIKVGLFNWNRGTVGASSQLPFGGSKKSGNNWPAGSFAFLYCAEARSYLKAAEEEGIENLPADFSSLWKDKM